MTVRIIWTLEDWATAIVDLPATGPLPDRTVLVPNERVAHALRRTLVERGCASALIGTRFITLLQFAGEIIAQAGEFATVNDHELGATLVREAFSEVAFARFHREDLLGLPSWNDAFADALSDAEAALLVPNDLLSSPDPHVADVGRVHEALSKKGELVTRGGLMQRAAALARAVKTRTTVLVVVTGFETPAEVRLLQALPEVVWAKWLVRPLSSEHTNRMVLLLGVEFANAMGPSHPTLASTSALQHLQANLFVAGMETPAPSDDSIRIATYAGVHEEVEAAVCWVTEQIVERGVPAQEIAILSSVAEPYGSLLRARLGALPWHGGAEPTFSEQGVPLTERSDGARLLQAIRALREGLSRDALAPLLPILRTTDPTRRVRGLSRAWELLNTVAAIGGDFGHATGEGTWANAWQSTLLRLDHGPTGSSGLEDLEEKWRGELRLDLTALATAITALDDLLRFVAAAEPLSVIWKNLSSFAECHLKLPPATPTASSVLDGALTLFVGHEAREPTGHNALAWLEDALTASVVQTTRFGAPAVYLGTLAGAFGLSFRAVRLIGLVEGAVPSAVRQDPVLPDAARAALSPFLLTSRERAHRQIAAFDGAVRAAREQLVLSAPRVSLEGSTRQPAAVLLDVVRALFGANDTRGLEQQLEDAARTGRAHERQMRERLVISPAAALDRIARGDQAIARAEANPALALDALRAIRDRTEPTAQDGLLGGVLPSTAVAGLSTEKPISASRLATLLSCPHRYLYEHVLGFREPEDSLPTHGLPVMTFGTWLHGIAEEFWREHGAVLSTRSRGLAYHQQQLRALAYERVDSLRQTYPFASEAVAHAQREALCDQLDKLLTLDWGDGTPRAFVAVERAFGYDEPCQLETEAGPLHVRGKIDKLDSEGGTLLVRDIKTGAGKPRRADDPPDLGIDLQLGVYALVAKRMARAWNTPARVGVAYVYLRSGEPHRSWTGADYALLDNAARSWLATALETLQHGAFVRSPNLDDCTYCPHQPVCSQERHRAAAVLDDPRVPRRLASLKTGERS